MTALRTWLAITVVMLAAALAPPAHSAVSASVTGPSPREARLLTLTNGERTLRNARTLIWDATLCDAARQHSREMAELAYFDHRSPVRGLETPAERWERANRFAPAEYMIGENIFYGSDPDAAWGHRSLMTSPDHRANILNPAFARVGIGVYISQNGEMWVTEMFVS
jgi:uncharacterized protein YkwD